MTGRRIVPPGGGTATTALIDVRDRTTVLRQYKNPADAGSNDAAKFDATSYTYDLAGNLRKTRRPRRRTPGPTPTTCADTRPARTTPTRA